MPALEWKPMTRLVYTITGLLALYRAAAPLISAPSPHPQIGVLFWTAAISLLLAGLGGTQKGKDIWALVGSSLVVAVYVYGLFLLPLARKLGYVPFRAQLEFHQANWFDRWRPLLDTPVWALLLIFSIVALCVSLAAVRKSRAT
jgi:hypothetical protein